MATVVIDFQVDDKALQSTIDKLVKTGQVAEDDAKKFNELGAASKKAAEGLQAPLSQLNDTLKETGNNVVKAFSQDVVNNVSKSTQQFVSLRQQIKEATNDAIVMARQFGELSPQAVKAREKVAGLRKELGDTQKGIAALDPEAKFTAISQAVRGIAGGFAAAQGAFALFGDKSEEVEKAILKVQGALAFSQGINEILQLGDALKNIKAVLGITTTATAAQTVAQGALATATTTQAVATEGAAVATKSFTAALLTNPVTIAIAAVAALASAYLILAKDTETAAEAQAKYNALFEEREKKLGAAASGVTEKYVKEVNFRAETDKQYAISTAKNSEELERRLSQIDLSRAKSVVAFVNAQRKLGFELSSELQSQYKAAIDLLNDSTVREIKAREDKAKKISDANKKIQDELAKEAEKQEKDRRDRESKALEQALKLDLLHLEEEKQRELAVEEFSAQEKLRIDIKYLEEKRKLFEGDAVSQKEIDVEIARTKAELAQQEIKDRKESADAFQKQNEDLIKRAQKAKDEESQAFEKAEKKKQDAILATIALISDSLNAFKGLTDALSEARVSDLEEQKSESETKAEEETKNLEQQFEKRKISKRKYESELAKIEKKKADDQKKIDDQIRAEKRKQAELDKALALFNIAIHTAEAVSKTSATLGFLGAFAIPLVIALGVAQAAAVIATPLPKFHSGRLAKTNNKEELAIIREDETIFNPDQSKQFAPTFAAIYHKQIKPIRLNEFVRQELKGSFAQNVTASIDTMRLAHDIAYVLRDQSTISTIKNADEIGKVIANYIPKPDPRKW